MPIDTSMYAPQQGNNIIQQFGQVQGIANAAEQNKIMQAHEQLQGLNISTDKAKLLDQQFGLIGQKLAEVYGADNGEPKRDHVLNGVSDLIAHNPGVFDYNFAAQALGDVPGKADVDKDPNALKSWLIAKASRTQQAREAIAPLLPDLKPVDVGGQIQMVDMNPRTNPKLANMQLQKGLSPSEASTPTVTGYTPEGAEEMGTRQQYIDKVGGAPAAPAPAGAIPGAPASPAPAGAAPGAPRPIVKPAPGTVESNIGMADDARKHATAIFDAGVMAQQHQGILRNMLQEGDEFTSGPLAHMKKEAVSGLNEVAGHLGLPQIAPETVAAQEGYAKFAQLLARQQLASGTNDDRTSAIASNPNDALSNMGKRRMAQVLLGNADAARAKADALQDYVAKNGPGSSYRFESELGANFDQRAYQLQHMDAQERAKYLATMPEGEHRAIAKAWAYAKKAQNLKPGEGVSGQ